MPAYAIATAGAPVDVEPEEKRAPRAASPSPRSPDQGVSQRSSTRWSRDLHADAPRGARRPPSDEPSATAAARPRRARDLRREDLVLKDDKPEAREPEARRATSAHGRSR